jgi:acyl-CoA synthetase (AMP-forming)/AMP-acid ligase II
MSFRSPHPDVHIPDASLGDVVLANALSHPDRPALVDASTDRVVTYGELIAQVRAVAAGFAALGIRKGDVVAIWSPNSPEFAIVFHAVAKLGAIVTTANPVATPFELARQLTDAGAQLLVTTAALLDRAREAVDQTGRPIAVITTDEAPGAPSLRSTARDEDPPAVTIVPAEDVIALPYSSGTTGLPKGVMLTHRNLVANLMQVDALEHRDLRAFVGVLPFFHIYGMLVILNFALMRGATIVTMPRFELELFLKVLQEWPIALAHIVPPMAVALAKHPAVDNYKFPHLKWLFSGAAPLGPELTAAIRQRLGVTIRQGYGMTECSPASHYTAPGADRDGTIGPLVPCTEGRVVDPVTGADLGAGEPGEVWVRGPQVMKGYLNNPDATASTVDADGWLRTGDIGVVDADGYLTIVDRLKELIKVKGYQVAPAELESLLLDHPLIADAAVIPVPDSECGERPKAFVVARGPLSADDVHAFVHERVSHYKRLRDVAFVDAIPKSPSGKILRRVLIEQERTARAAAPSA